MDRRAVNAILGRSKFRFVGSGHHGYRSAFVDAESGARVETDSLIQGMDTHVTMSGQTLDVVRSWYPNGDDGLLAAVREVKGRVSRVDLAVNIHDGHLTVRDFYSAYLGGDLKSKSRRAYYVEGVGDDRAGDTFYIGSPKSDRQCRVYNKGAEQGMVDRASWLRLELALRDLRAKAVVTSTRDHTVANVISGHVGDYLVWDEAEYAYSLGSQLAPVEPMKRKCSSTERWLLEQCAPALARVYNVKPEFMVEFMASFRKSLDKLRSEG